MKFTSASVWEKRENPGEYWNGKEQIASEYIGKMIAMQHAKIPPSRKSKWNREEEYYLKETLCTAFYNSNNNNNSLY